MIYGDLQFFDILIFAAIAGFIIYRLRSVLGKRTGFQKNISEPKPQETKKQEDVQKIPSLMDNETKLEAVYKKVNNFNHREFIGFSKVQVSLFLLIEPSSLFSICSLIKLTDIDIVSFSTFASAIPSTMSE